MRSDAIHYDLNAHDIRVSNPNDPAVVLLLHEDAYARQLLRRAVAAFDRVEVVESVTDAPKRISLVAISPEAEVASGDVPVLSFGDRVLRLEGPPEPMQRPSAKELRQAVARHLEVVHERSFEEEQLAIDERPSALVFDHIPAHVRSNTRALGWFRPYFRILATSDRDEALSLLQSNAFDVVVSDALLLATSTDTGPAEVALSAADLIIRTFAGLPTQVERCQPLAVFANSIAPGELVRFVASALMGRGFDPQLDSKAPAFAEGVQGSADVRLQPARLPRVLIVNDCEQITRSIARNLRLVLRGIVTDRAHGGAEALDHLSRSAVDLVLLDDLMQEVDGFDVIRTMRATNKTRHTPVILTTLYCDGRPPPGHPIARIALPPRGPELAHMIACALAERGFDLPPPDGGWPAFEEPYDHEYLAPALRERLIATAGAG